MTKYIYKGKYKTYGTKTKVKTKQNGTNRYVIQSKNSSSINVNTNQNVTTQR